MIKFLLWIWQLPQNLAGWIYSRFGNKVFVTDGKSIYTVYYAPCFNSAVSLGQYVIIDPAWTRVSTDDLIRVVKHEYGHSKMSKYSGIFYLLVVGLPYVTRNIMSRINSEKFSSEWYYSGYPEDIADKLGGVKR